MIPWTTLRTLSITRRNGLGDLLTTLPLALRCKELAPQASLTLLVDPRSAPLLPYLTHIAQGVPLAPYRNKYLSLLATSLAHPVDLAIGAKVGPMQLLHLSLLAQRARYRLAYTDARWSSRLINYPAAAPLPHSHQALSLLRLVDPDLAEIPPRLYPTLTNVTPLPSSHLLYSVSNNRVGSSWRLERVASVLSHWPGEIVLTGLSQDLPKAKALLPKLPRCRLEIGVPFDRFLGLIAGAKLVVATDGGVCHLAAALKRPQVTLFGGTSPHEWAPLSPLATLFSTPGHVDEIPLNGVIEALEKHTTF